MWKRLFYCIYLAILFNLQSRSQGLKIGDTVPDFLIQNVSNYTSSELSLRTFKKKLILLDFWSTNCVGCIHAFPKMDSLQKTFEQGIQIVLINRSTKDSTERFFSSHTRIHKPKLPFVTSDSMFRKLFPHRGEPYYILLDSNYVVRSFPEAVNKAIIERFLQNGNTGIAEHKKREYLKSAFDDRLLGAVQYSSALFKTVPGIQLTNTHQKGLEELSASFASILKLYTIAYDTIGEFDRGDIRPGRVELKVKDKTKYVMPTDPELMYEWYQTNSYTYQLLLPQNLKYKKYELMKIDLARFFGLEVQFLKKKVKCLTLVRSGNIKPLENDLDSAKNNFFPTYLLAVTSDSVRYFNKQPFKDLSERLSYIVEQGMGKPFFDATGYPPNKIVSLKMTGEAMDSFDLDRYRSELRLYGLDLIQKEQLITVMILKERKLKKRE